MKISLPTGAIEKAIEREKTMGPERARLKKATQDFEAIFLQGMLKSMRRTVPNSSGQGSESRLYTEMMDEAIANNMSKTGRFGLADLLYKSMEKRLDAGAQVPEDKKP